MTDFISILTSMGRFRLLHTSDWHLGQLLHEQSREYEHDCFLQWLLSTLESRQVDALLVAGDVFDGPNPSAQSQQLFYSFLASAKASRPQLDIVIIGGNHDSASRLDAPHPVLAAFGVSVIGGLARPGDGCADTERCLVTLSGSCGEPAACVAAVPYLRPGDLSVGRSEEDPENKLIQAIASIYQPLCREAVRRAGERLATIAAGHLYLTGCQISELSERKIQNGYLAAVPSAVFDSRVSYVALGHLHLGQAVSERIHYSGSPLPLSFAEIDYRHRVLLAEFEGPKLMQVHELPVPKPVEMLRIPRRGALSPEEAIHRLQGVEPLDGRAPSSPMRPYLEVRVRLDAPRPTLRDEITRVLEDKWPRLLKITPDYGDTDRSATPHLPNRRLDELDHEEIFRQCYRSRYGSVDGVPAEPSSELLQAFRMLWEHEEGEEAQ